MTHIHLQLPLLRIRYLRIRPNVHRTSILHVFHLKSNHVHCTGVLQQHPIDFRCVLEIGGGHAEVFLADAFSVDYAAGDEGGGDGEGGAPQGELVIGGAVLDGHPVDGCALLGGGLDLGEGGEGNTGGRWGADLGRKGF